MGIRGELLTLVDGAPGRLATLQGALTTWMHRDLAAMVHQRALEQAEADSDVLATVAGLPERVTDRDTGPATHPAGDQGTDRGPRAATGRYTDQGTDRGPRPATGPYTDQGTDPDTGPAAADQGTDRGTDMAGGRHRGQDADQDARPGDAPGGIASTVGGSAGRATDEGTGRGAPGSPPRAGAVDDGQERVTSWYVVVALPDRWRVVGRGHLAVSDGRRSWAGTSTLVTERDSARAAIHDAGAIGACLYPGALLGGLELAMPETAELEGRSCWLVEAQPRADVTGTSLATSAAPHALRLHRDLVGVEHRMWFDTATGILLRHEGYVEGERCSWTALSDLVFDAPVADDEFRPPPGAVVRSRHELLRDHLSEMGIDPDTVDLDDPAQVRDALRQGG